jgi:hypothetical protein
MNFKEYTVNVPFRTMSGPKGHGACMPSKATVRKGKKQPKRK